MKIIDITSAKVLTNYTGFGNLQFKGFKKVDSVIFDAGYRVNKDVLFSHIGNNELDKWRNVEKMRASSSIKKQIEYLSQFIDTYTEHLF
jgi:hypothetical protein